MQFTLLFILFTTPLFLLYLLAGIRMIYQYERGVVFTLGKYSATRQPGLTWILPIFQTMKR